MADQDQTSPTYTEEDIAAFEQYEKELAKHNQEAKSFKEHKDAGYDLYPAVGSAAGAAVPITGAAASGIANLGSKAIDAVTNRPSAGERWGEAVGGPGGKTVDEAVRNREIAKTIRPGEIVTKEGVIIPESAAPKPTPKVTPQAAKAAFKPEELDWLRRTGLLRKVLAGAGTGFDIGDAYKRYQQGDTTGAIISGLGALGYPVSKIPHPAATGLGYGMMFGAPALNQYRDIQNKPIQKASGGLTTLKKSVSHFAGGGEAGVALDALKAIKSAIKEAKAVKAGEKASSEFTPRPTVDMKLSEALGPHEGKRLILTQSDNYGVHDGRRGGTQFPNFQNIEPLAQAEKVVWMNDTPQHANSLIKLGGDNTVVAPYIGTQDQLKSNRSVWGDVMESHYKREKDLSPEQIDLINNRIATMKDNKKRLVFPQPFDIRDKFATQELGGDTFARRGVLSSMLGEGEGVGRTKSGIALPQYQDILNLNKDALTVGQPTTSVGSRLFTVDPTMPSKYDTRFNPNYNWTVHGKDLGVNVGFTPPEIAIAKYWNDYIKRTGKVPSGNGMFGYNKNAQDITHDYLMGMEKAGYAEGGPIKGGELGVGLRALSEMKAALQEAKAATPAVNRIDMNFKDVTKRVPEVSDAFKKLSIGQIDQDMYDAIVNQHKPVSPFSFVPQPVSHEEAIAALNKQQQPKYGAIHEIEEGSPAKLRLDIPAYTRFGKWINSIHQPNKPTVYNNVSHVTDAVMDASVDKGMKIAGGGSKTPYATINGLWKPVDETSAVKRAQEYLNHPDWAQVGFDPERHSYFYDRATMQPVSFAEEVLQIGPLVLAKKPKYGNKKDFKYAEGGEVEFTNKYGTAVGQDQYGNQVLPQPTELDMLKEMIPDRSTFKAIPRATGILGRKLAEEAKKEWDKSGPRAIPDIALNSAALLGGSVSDLISGFSPSLNKGEETNPMLGVGQEKEKPNLLGSEQIHDFLREKGITKDDYPLAEGALLLGGPSLIKRAPGLISKSANFIGEGLAENIVNQKGVGKYLINPELNMVSKDGPRFTSNKVEFTSPLEDSLTDINTMHSDQWKGWLKNQPKSVRKDAEASGLDSLLNSKTGQISKDEVLNHLKNESPRISKKVLSTDTWVEQHPEGDFYVVDRNGDITGERFHEYNDALAASQKLGAQWGRDELNLPDWDKNYREILLTNPWNKSPSGKDFKQGHYPDTPNLLAHLRVNDRTSAEGKPALFVEEVQSDWGQTGRKKGFDLDPINREITPEELKAKHYHELNDDQKRWMGDFDSEMERILSNQDHPGAEHAYENLMDKFARWVDMQNEKRTVPSGPYVKDTKDWTSLAIKHAIKDAIENKKEQVAWTTGAQQNLRNAKEHAPKGMEDFYDNIMQQTANDILKKLGAKERVRPIEFDFPEHYPARPFDTDRPEYFDTSEIVPAHRSKQWGFDITPELREKILKEGLPKFGKGGGVGAGLDILGEISSAIKEAKTPYEIAHEIAQKNAVKMLGLHPENTAKDRAKAMGFDVENPMYHGTTSDISEFNSKEAAKKTGNVTSHFGTFLSDNPQEANRYAEGWGKLGGNVLPAFASMKKPFEMSYKDFDSLAMGAWNRMMREPGYDPKSQVNFGDMEGQRKAAESVEKHTAAAIQDVIKRKQELISKGHDGIVVSIGGNKEYIPFEPNKIRSPFAAFDPAEAHLGDLLKAKGGNVTNSAKEEAQRLMDQGKSPFKNYK
jgi:hypothetical protein